MRSERDNTGGIKLYFPTNLLENRFSGTSMTIKANTAVAPSAEKFLHLYLKNSPRQQRRSFIIALLHNAPNNLLTFINM